MRQSVVGLIAFVMGIGLSLISTLPVQAAQDRCAKGDCQDGWGTAYIYVDEHQVGEYEGSFKNGQRDGWGTATLVGSNYGIKWVYQGEWRAGKKHGWGHVPEQGSRSVLGKHTWQLWKFGELVVSASQVASECIFGNCDNGKGVLYAENGVFLEAGQFKNGQLEGKVARYSFSGHFLKGTIKDGKWEGQAVQFNNKAKIMTVSTYVAGEEEGPVHFYFMNGKYIVGQYKNGELVEGSLKTLEEGRK